MTHRLFFAALMVALFSSVTCGALRAESLLTPTCVHHGDVSLDGNISAGDAQMAFSIVLGTVTPTYEEGCAADCTGDGTVTAGDAQSIFYVVLGIGECADPLEPSTPVPTDTPTQTPTLMPTNTPVFVSVGNMISISAGTFEQGSLSGEPCRNSNETQFTHTLTRNLSVMETEITRQMWSDLRAVQATLPVDPSSIAHSPTLSHPVQQNMWYESVLFANLLSLQNGYTRCYYTDSGFTDPITFSSYTTGPFYCDFDADGYRLPTEGEWEYFTRAGTTTAFSCSEPNYNSGNCTSCTSGTHPTLEQYCEYCANNPGISAVAGSKLANPWGLKDVHGNVWEWCWDRYSASYPSPSATDYTGPSSGSSRVLRGASFTGSASYCRSSYRHNISPSSRGYNLGFRLVRTSP